MSNECQIAKSMVRQAHHGFILQDFLTCHPELVEGWALDLIWHLNFDI
jgi:hypothetical protein